MNKKLFKITAIASLVAMLSGTVTTHAFNLKDAVGTLLKVGGTTYVVDRYGDNIDSFLNKILNQNNFGTNYDTKVVPILSMGDGKHIGAAQVTGPGNAIAQVQGVLQIETKFNAIRIKGLVPVDSKNPLEAKRVQGVGVSAIIDAHF